MDNEKLHFLTKISFLSELTPQERMDLANELEWETCSKGTVLIEQGFKPAFVYLLYQGQVEIHAQNNEYTASQTLGPGSILGELSIVTDKASAISVRCTQDSRLLRIKAEDFARLLLRWPQIYRTIIGQLSENLHEANQLLSENRYRDVLRSAIQLTQYRDKFYGIWGSVKTTREIERKLEELEARAGHMLIKGERGTGRQMVAWYAHQRLYGEAAPFVVVDGRRFDQQWGSLLAEPGNGAAAKTSSLPYYSLFDIATGGTLFIQEIDLIPPQTQYRLAQSLKAQKIMCLVIGSMQLEPHVKEEKLIPELQECFTHIHTITPLRERKRDIPILTQGILEKLAAKNHRPTPALTPEATQLLLSHHYRQGNVTELIQVVERAFFLAEQGEISLDQIFFGPTAEKIGRKLNLLQWEIFAGLFEKGDILHWTRRVTAVLFMVVVLGLVFSPQLPLMAKIFTLVWGLWWPALAIISPFLGRVWCTICPFSTIMDYVQKKLHFKYALPAWLIKYDYLLVSALFIFIFWVEIFSGMRSNPFYTALLLIAIQAAAIIIGVFYPRHAWCRHLCPLGGFIGSASIGSILEVRSDPAVCLNKCTTFECYVGKGEVKGCPMSQHLPYLDNNLDCKLCFNCVRNCPHGSVQVNLRVPAREVWHLTRVNQGYTIFIGAMLGILFPMIYFEKLNGIWTPEVWKAWFTLAYFAAAFLGGFIGWWLGKPFKSKAASTRIKLVFAFTPLIIAGHIMYQVGFVPGIDALAFGIGFQTSQGLLAQFIPATFAAQVMAAAIGLFLTALTVSIVVVKQKRKNKLKV